MNDQSSVFPNRILPYLLLAPSAILVIVFFIVPAIQSLELSFYRVNAISGRRIFVGLENFTRLFQSTEYLNSITTTAIFIIVVVVGGLALSLLLAVGAGLPIKGFGIYRTLLIWPYALSPAIAGTIWALLTDPTIGVVTEWLSHLGITFNRNTDSTHAMIFLIIAAAWKMLGYNIVFFMAGLKNISQEVIEAASLDGANAWVRFWRMTFPLLTPTTLFLLIMNTLYAAFQTFGLIDITTQGGPGRATYMLIYKLYNDGFKNVNLIGSASAQSILLLVFVAAITIFQYRTVGERTFYQ
ncbi:MAG: sn-glycerol-3-phosphate ABC transporter permease UgpA [Anaerolineae bacterium]